jgi:hypothetical protein
MLVVGMDGPSATAAVTLSAGIRSPSILMSARWGRRRCCRSTTRRQRVPAKISKALDKDHGAELNGEAKAAHPVTHHARRTHA